MEIRILMLVHTHTYHLSHGSTNLAPKPSKPWTCLPGLRLRLPLSLGMVPIGPKGCWMTSEALGHVCVGLGAGVWAIIFVAALVTQQQAVNCLSSLAIADLGNLAHHPGLTSEDHATITSSIYLYTYIYPCIEFGRLGCACIIFKWANECYHFGSSGVEPK